MSPLKANVKSGFATTETKTAPNGSIAAKTLPYPGGRKLPSGALPGLRGIRPTRCLSFAGVETGSCMADNGVPSAAKCAVMSRSVTMRRLPSAS
jgi:hypothetical protein